MQFYCNSLLLLLAQDKVRRPSGGRRGGVKPKEGRMDGFSQIHERIWFMFDKKGLLSGSRSSRLNWSSPPKEIPRSCHGPVSVSPEPRALGNHQTSGQTYPSLSLALRLTRRTHEWTRTIISFWFYKIERKASGGWKGLQVFINFIRHTIPGNWPSIKSPEEAERSFIERESQYWHIPVTASTHWLSIWCCWLLARKRGWLCKRRSRSATIQFRG